jgi:hypothetical protein
VNPTDIIVFVFASLLLDSSLSSPLLRFGFKPYCHMTFVDAIPRVASRWTECYILVPSIVISTCFQPFRKKHLYRFSLLSMAVLWNCLLYQDIAIRCIVLALFIGSLKWYIGQYILMLNLIKSFLLSSSSNDCKSSSIQQIQKRQYSVLRGLMLI